ncbi:sugar ABC transporter substrate-binding protein [Luteipulveratus halotolerans]|uniref:Sugar ABC transporter substrate-binding protein n=1 Tax=Luteipulveratus halotolerans TaxID=1631356 RepID=A0A0L6CIQ9_9MICO|nr:sugar ABC transporter substrate-binding protein [Luteipulveratus halotolerans]KNX37480.1 sugar ABC transporter substrate-binding protein [Luteipulveratus halotolerans]
MRWSRTTGVAAVAALGLLLAGCGDDGSGGSSGGGGDSTGAGGGGAGGGKTITWWVMKGTNPDSTAFYNTAKATFKKQTGATLNIQEVEWADAHDKLVRTFAGGGGPDVSEIGTTWNPEFAAAGGLVDLTDKINAAGLNKDLLPALKDSATYEGKQWGVGWYAGTRGIVYRKDVFDKLGLKPPTTWNELQQTVKTLKSKQPDMAAFPVAGGSAYAAAPFVWGAGGDFATQNGDQWKGALDTPQARAGLTFYTDLANKDGASTKGAATWKETDLLDSFTKGKAAMVIQGNWTPKAAVEKDPSLKGKIAAFAVPGKDGGMAPTFLGGSNLAMLKTSKNQDLAWKLIQMLTTGELSKQWADQTGFFPSTTSGMKTYANSSDPLVAPFAKAMMSAGKNVPGAPQWGAVEGEKTLTQMLQSILTGTSVDDATTKASDAITKTLNAGS